jgi:hypothetical protein
MFLFLRQEPSVTLEEVVVRTAFFRRTAAIDLGPDGWELQGINRRTVFRYSWRDQLRKLLGRGNQARNAGGGSSARHSGSEEVGRGSGRRNRLGRRNWR